jgi:pentatricopeptide repeat protein
MGACRNFASRCISTPSAVNPLFPAPSCRLQWLNKQISSLGQRKELSKAVSCFEQVSSEGLAPSVHTYTSIINAHVRSGEIDAAEGYLARMRGAGLSPNVVTYTALLKGFTQIGDLGKASGLLEQMEKDVPPVAPNVRTVNTMLRGCIRANDVPCAVRYGRIFQGAFRCRCATAFLDVFAS